MELGIMYFEHDLCKQLYGVPSCNTRSKENNIPEDLTVIILWYPLWVYMYLKVGMTHFYRLALCNLVLGLTNILMKSKLFRWWMSHDRFWSSHHHRDTVRTDYIGMKSFHFCTSFISIDYLLTFLFKLSFVSFTVYKARF